MAKAKRNKNGQFKKKPARKTSKKRAAKRRPAKKKTTRRPAARKGAPVAKKKKVANRRRRPSSSSSRGFLSKDVMKKAAFGVVGVVATQQVLSRVGPKVMPQMLSSPERVAVATAGTAFVVGLGISKLGGGKALGQTVMLGGLVAAGSQLAASFINRQSSQGVSGYQLGQYGLGQGVGPGALPESDGGFLRSLALAESSVSRTG